MFQARFLVVIAETAFMVAISPKTSTLGFY